MAAFKYQSARIRSLAVRLIVPLILVGLLTAVGYRLGVNATTMGFAFLILVLLIATARGLTASLVASIASVLCFNFYFLPPLGTFTIADPKNWVALFAFFITAILASRLSIQAQRRECEALDRRREIERLYLLSQRLLATVDPRPFPRQLIEQISATFELPRAALYDMNTQSLYSTEAATYAPHLPILRAAATGGLRGSLPDGTLVLPIRLGGQALGSLALESQRDPGQPPLSEVALDALTHLVALLLEKARFQDLVRGAELSRQSQELKSTLLDALAHDFKTPLTAIKAASSALLTSLRLGAESARELIGIIDSEADRLERLMSDSLAMTRMEAGEIRLDREPCHPGELVQAACRAAASRLEGRPIRIAEDRNLPSIAADREAILLCLRQLLENAAQYSSPGTAIEIEWEHDPTHLAILVRDYGEGIMPTEECRIFERYYRGEKTRGRITGAGLGLYLAREIARRHGGELELAPASGPGSRFRLNLPVIAEALAGKPEV